MKILNSFHPYAIITIVFWSLAYVLTRLTLQYFSASSLGFLRYGIASLMLLFVYFITKMPFPRMRDIPLFIASGITGFFLYMVAFNSGTRYVTAATSSVIIACAPVFTALLANVLLREKLMTHQWIAIAVEFAGILVLTMYGGVFSANIGVLWLLSAALLLSCYNLLQRKLTRTYSALQSTTYSIFCGTVLLAMFSPQSLSELIRAPAIQIVYILLLGIFSSAIAYIAWSKAFEKAEKTSMVSNYMFFTPFITGVLGFALAGEIPEPSTWVGGAFIILGALLFNKEIEKGKEK